MQCFGEIPPVVSEEMRYRTKSKIATFVDIPEPYSGGHK